MFFVRLLGIVVLVLGLGAVIYGGFIYSPEAADIVIGPIEMSIGEEEAVNTPLWAGIVAIIGGLLLTLVPFAAEPKAA